MVMRAWASEGMRSVFDLCASLVHIFGVPATLVHPRAQKRERLVARVTREDKDVIAHAAALVGQSVGSYVVAEVRKAALRALEARERIVLNAAQSRRFVEALLSPPRKATPQILAAMRAYKGTVKSDLD